jgi:hypothetical protein
VYVGLLFYNLFISGIIRIVVLLLFPRSGADIIWDRWKGKIPGLNTIQGVDMSTSCCVVVVSCQVRSLRWVDLTSKEPYQMSKGFVVSELALNLITPDGLIHGS